MCRFRSCRARRSGGRDAGNACRVEAGTQPRRLPAAQRGTAAVDEPGRRRQRRRPLRERTARAGHHPRRHRGAVEHGDGARRQAHRGAARSGLFGRRLDPACRDDLGAPSDHLHHPGSRGADLHLGHGHRQLRHTTARRRGGRRHSFRYERRQRRVPPAQPARRRLCDGLGTERAQRRRRRNRLRRRRGADDGAAGPRRDRAAPRPAGRSSGHRHGHRRCRSSARRRGRRLDAALTATVERGELLLLRRAARANRRERPVPADRHRPRDGDHLRTTVDRRRACRALRRPRHARRRRPDHRSGAVGAGQTDQRRGGHRSSHHEHRTQDSSGRAVRRREFASQDLRRDVRAGRCPGPVCRRRRSCRTGRGVRLPRCPDARARSAADVPSRHCQRQRLRHPQHRAAARWGGERALDRAARRSRRRHPGGRAGPARSQLHHDDRRRRQLHRHRAEDRQLPHLLRRPPLDHRPRPHRCRVELPRPHGRRDRRT